MELKVTEKLVVIFDGITMVQYFKKGQGWGSCSAVCRLIIDGHLPLWSMLLLEISQAS